jgi:hypothetical protein
MNAIFRTWLKSIAGQAAKSVYRRTKVGSRRRASSAWVIEPLEWRTLMTAITVTSTSATPNYASSVTVAELNPIATAVTLRDAINAADNAGGSNSIVLQSSVTYSFTSATSTINFSSNVVGTTYTWTNNNVAIGIGASGSGSSIAGFTATNGGTIPVTATFMVTPTADGVPGAPVSFAVTVDPVNSAPTVASVMPLATTPSVRPTLSILGRHRIAG